MQEIAKFEGELSVIAQSSEKHISFQWKNLKKGFSFLFLDSFAFTISSLDDLVKDLEGNTPILDSKSPNALFKRKGVYPYEWVDSIEKFKETQLPPKKAFHSELDDEDITDTNYKHAQEVWEKMNCKTFYDYHKFYPEADVLLLADVFEKFRKTAITEYKIDPANC